MKITRFYGYILYEGSYDKFTGIDIYHSHSEMFQTQESFYEDINELKKELVEKVKKYYFFKKIEEEEDSSFTITYEYQGLVRFYHCQVLPARTRRLGISDENIIFHC